MGVGGVSSGKHWARPHPRSVLSSVTSHTPGGFRETCLGGPTVPSEPRGVYIKEYERVPFGRDLGTGKGRKGRPTIGGERFDERAFRKTDLEVRDLGVSSGLTDGG